jgi:hypothetical protein
MCLSPSFFSSSRWLWPDAHYFWCGSLAQHREEHEIGTFGRIMTWRERYQHEQATIRGWLLHREALLNGRYDELIDYHTRIHLEQFYRGETIHMP